MTIWCDKPYLTIISDYLPLTIVRKPFPSDTDEIKEDKAKYPYINCYNVIYYINYLGTSYTIEIPKDYKWDGTSCFGFHHYPPLLNASMIHDILCENHWLVGNDRQLSSIIFREIGIASGMDKSFMKIAYLIVDIFQKYFGKDKNGNKWPH